MFDSFKSVFVASLFLTPVLLHAQGSDWRAETDSIQQVIKAAENTVAQLTAAINAWKKSGTDYLTGRQQAQWASYLAELNRYSQTLISYSDRWEAARKLAPEEFVKRFASWENNDKTATRLSHLQLLTHLLAADRTLYALTDSLRLTVGNSRLLRNRLNEGNRSFGIQYGIFAEMQAIYFDPARNRRTRSRYLQLREQQDFLESIKATEPELYSRATGLWRDPTLQKMARQSEAAVLLANSLRDLHTVVEPAADLATHTLRNFSQFFGNFIGDYFFKVRDLFGKGESRGHALPDFYRYYSHPAGHRKGLHPAKVRTLAANLRAGDILFDKTRFAITDKLIPGYLGHVAIYLENYEALQQLGVLDSPTLRLATHGMAADKIDLQVRAYAAELAGISEKEEWVRLSMMRRRTAAKTYNGRPLNPLLFEALYRLRYERENVLEALRDGQALSGHEGGVTLNRFAHFIYVDDFAAVGLRQKNLSAKSYRENLARFLALALLQYGKPYDFRFDVNTLDAIVCSELIYQSFVDIDFKTGKSLTSYTISPDQVAREAGIQTVFDTLKLDPPFELRQWYFEAAPFYPALDSTASADSLLNRAFMAMVREEYGGLNLLAPAEKNQFEAIRRRAEGEREKESERLRQLPVIEIAAVEAPPDRLAERRLQNFYITLDRQIEQARAAGKSEDEIGGRIRREIETFARDEGPVSNERIAALIEDFKNWQSGAAYNPNYADLYSGRTRFLLSVFRSASVAADDGFGRGLDLQLAVTNEAQQSFRYSQYYAFLPWHLQFFDKSGNVDQTVQGGAMLARIARRFTQGDYIEMNALAWRYNAYSTSFLPFTLEIGGDKGLLDIMLKLTTIGNGHYRHGFYLGEMGRLELAPFERRRHRRAFAIANLYYGIRAQFTAGKFSFFAAGRLGARSGQFAERGKQNSSAGFPPIRTWSCGVELFGAALSRPVKHRLEFEVSEDDARFIQGRLQKDRQARISYRWSVND